VSKSACYETFYGADIVYFFTAKISMQFFDIFLAATRGSGAEGAVPAGTLISFAIGG
jgi:hypothetical protein